MLVALLEARDAHQAALETARAENDLAREQPIWLRRRVLREIRSWRDPQTEKSLALVDVVSFSWTLLVVASGAATIQAAMGL